MDWKEKLSRCFGLSDRKFAGHPSDKQRAYELLGYLIQQNIGMSEVEAELRIILKDTHNLHEDEQIERVRDFFKLWLDD